MARLYPPVTEEVLSAFCLNYSDKGEKTGASLNINFNLNRAVANAEIAGIALRLRTISTNQYIITENLAKNQDTNQSEGYAISYSLDDGTCTFAISAENNPDAIAALKVGQFYKAQLAFIGLTGTIGYWSTVSTIKCVAKPTVTIANYTPSDANVFTNEILGEYTQDTSTGDSSEKVYSYRFQLFDAQGFLLDDTGVQLHNSSNDISSNSSTDSYYCYKELNDGQSYYIVYSVTTINGLSVSSPRYQIITAQSVDPEEDITLVVTNGINDSVYNHGVPTGGFSDWQPWEEGLIKIYPDLNAHIFQPSIEIYEKTKDERITYRKDYYIKESEEVYSKVETPVAEELDQYYEKKKVKQPYIDKSITGNFIILRSSSKDNFGTWQEVKRFRLKDEKPYNTIIYDYTVEQGITYRYAIQQYNRQKFYSKKVYAYKRNPNDGSILYKNALPIYDDITADFEDMFLYDGKRQLKIRFNPKVSSFKNDLQEQKIDTIGSKHPFIFRNGNVCYKEFPISGLISFQEDNAKFFITDEDYNQMKLERFEPDKNQRDSNFYIGYVLLTEDEITDAINNNVELYQRVKETRSIKELSGHEGLQSEYEKATVYSYYKPFESSEAVKKYIDACHTPDIEDGRTRYVEVYKKALIDSKKEKQLKEQIQQLVNREINNINTFPLEFWERRSGASYPKIMFSAADPDIHRDSYSETYSEPKLYNKTDLTSENIMSERYFKLLVLDWLTDGKPKLFRSPTEGNYIVRLLNVSLTPKTELGRMIHEFSCTAYEVADFDYQSLLDLGILTIDESNEIEKQWFSKNINEIFTPENKQSNGYYPIDLENKDLTEFQCTGFAPGDIIKIMTKESAIPIEITIGTTGTYVYDEGRTILSISILPATLEGDFSRNIQLGTQGYSNQKFDTVASINTYTQMGEQLVGPVRNFLGKTIVGNGLYYKSPNVDLILAYHPLDIQPTDGTYQTGKYYIFQDGRYILSYNNYDPNEIYYEPQSEGTKLRISEILHLHAKKREVIPIFYNEWSSQGGASAIIGNQNNLPQFSLTPYGQGYIRSKSTMPKIRKEGNNTVNLVNWTSGLGNLTDEELTHARSIYDLVDFVISKCNKDIFCLFEVYVPNDKNAATEWVPYSQKNFHGDRWAESIYGIYDPWLYEQQTLKMNKEDQRNYQHFMGWWPKTPLNPSNTLPSSVITVLSDYGLYDPTITFYYNEKDLTGKIVEKSIVIDLNDKGEISLDNIKIPTSISIGNGVVMEPIYRLQCIDYTIENENTNLKRLKNLYLATKEEAQAKILGYRAAINAKARGELLMRRYNNELEKIRDIENYNAVVAELTENARQEQINKLQTYFNQEKGLVNAIMAQLQNIDNELMTDAGDPYTKNNEIRIYGEGSKSIEAKTHYDNYFDNTELFTKTNNILIPILLSKIANKDKTGTVAAELAKNNIEQFIYHINQSHNYNFNSVIRELEGNLQKNISLVDNILNQLENRIYVSQYLELLDQMGKDLFFSTIGEKINLKKYDFSTYQVYQLISKAISQNINETQVEITDLQNYLITNSEIWNKFFHFQTDEFLHQLNEASPVRDQTGKVTSYTVANLQKYLNGDYHLDATCLVEANHIITTINNKLTAVNNSVGNGETRDIRKQNYNRKYAPQTYDIAFPPNFDNKQFQLGAILTNNNINKTLYTLETIIDSIYLSDPTISNEQFFNRLDTNLLYATLPAEIKNTVKTYITKYVTSPGENQESPRDIYEKIVACIVYRDTHINELSEDQKIVIQHTIENYKSLSTFSNFINASEWRTIQNYLTTWQTDFNQVAEGEAFEAALEELNNYIDDFNKIINYKTTIIAQFKDYVERYNKTLKDYSVSDNIKEILWDEKNIYLNAIQRLEEVRTLFNLQIEKYQKDVLFVGYLEFLKAYIDQLNNSSSQDKAKYLQLLEEAQALAKATVKEEDNPYNQQKIIDMLWKNFLDALAQTYKTEIKERFG